MAPTDVAQGSPDAWLVQWFRANGDAGSNVYVKEDDARRAAANLEKYSSSETTAGVTPLYAAQPPAAPVETEQMAETLAWALCEAAGGGGKGKCDIEHCVCGSEGRNLAEALKGSGLSLCRSSAETGGQEG